MERLCTTGVYSIEGGYNAAQLWQVMCRIHIVDTLRLKQQESCSKNDYIQHDMIWSENDMWNDIIWYYDTTWYDNGYIYLIYKHLTIYIILYIYTSTPTSVKPPPGFFGPGVPSWPWRNSSSTSGTAQRSHRMWWPKPRVWAPVTEELVVSWLALASGKGRWLSRNPEGGSKPWLVLRPENERFRPHKKGLLIVGNSSEPTIDF